MATKHEVIEDELQAYLAASKNEKSRMLDRLKKTLKRHRKAICRRF
jgi:hypothetical protein